MFPLELEDGLDDEEFPDAIPLENGLDDEEPILCRIRRDSLCLVVGLMTWLDDNEVVTLVITQLFPYG